MSAPVGDVEDIVRIDADGSLLVGSDFERMDSVAECLAGMRKHLHHNGVVLDGMQRLSHLCSQGSLSLAQRRANMALLGPQGLGVVLLPAMQHYHFDHRLQVHACALSPHPPSLLSVSVSVLSLSLFSLSPPPSVFHPLSLCLSASLSVSFSLHESIH